MWWSQHKWYVPLSWFAILKNESVCSFSENGKDRWVALQKAKEMWHIHTHGVSWLHWIIQWEIVLTHHLKVYSWVTCAQSRQPLLDSISGGFRHLLVLEPCQISDMMLYLSKALTTLKGFSIIVTLTKPSFSRCSLYWQKIFLLV